MERAWEIPLPGAKTPTLTAIHAHCLLLYFLQIFGLGTPVLYPAYVPHASAFIYNVLFALRHTTHPTRRSGTPDRQAQTHAKTEFAIGYTAQHRIGVRMGYR